MSLCPSQSSQGAAIVTHLSKAGIEDSVRDLVGNLVRVALTDRLGGEEEAAG